MHTMPDGPQEKRRRSDGARTPSPGLGMLGPSNMTDCDASPLATSGSSAGSPTTPEYMSVSNPYIRNGINESFPQVPLPHHGDILNSPVNWTKAATGESKESIGGVGNSIPLVVPSFQKMEVIDPNAGANQMAGNLKFSVGTGRSISLSPRTRTARTPRTYRKSRSVSVPIVATEDLAPPALSESMDKRRQKRLERNRESARLSRRRRKQYLDVLEERVNQLSVEMDQGRRKHVMGSISILREQRKTTLLDKYDQEDTLNNAVKLLDNSLSRSSAQLRVAGTFQMQQVKSLSLPSHTKFLLWLTLQNNSYFRGGRAASERLSAARIGERLLSSGRERVPPSDAMWPLLCNDVGLSYDQEERFRQFQRTLLQNPESWLHRHTALASELAMTSLHDGMQSVTLRVNQRDAAVSTVLSGIQRLKLQVWSERNKERIARLRERIVKPVERTRGAGFVTSPQHHLAANLYIVNYQLQQIFSDKIPKAAPLVFGSSLKRLMRRPSFESLGCAADRAGGKDEGHELTRDSSFPSAASFASNASLKNSSSFASSGSLKRSASEMSMEDEEGRGHATSVSPESAQSAAAEVIEKTLGFVRSIMPVASSCIPSVTSTVDVSLDTLTFTAASPTPTNEPVVEIVSAPAPTPAAAIEMKLAPPLMPAIACPDPTLSAAGIADVPAVAATHCRKPSFLPPHLNVVPEESFLPENADEFFLNFTEEDWAIGEGLDMDTTS